MMGGVTQATNALLYLYLMLLVIMMLATTTSVKAAAPTEKPHIVFLLVDDWGWANVGYHRQSPNSEVITPNFDNLVKEGLEFDQHYAYRVCTPSRSSFLSGRLPIHVNDQLIEVDYYNPRDNISGFQGIPRNMTGIAEKMREGGYATHFVGKWDAGMATFEHTPMGRGFDTSLGYFNHQNDYFTEVGGKCGLKKIVDLWNTGKPATGMNGMGPDRYEEGLFAQHVMEIIMKHDTSTPLFLYYAAHIAHEPLQIPDEYLKPFVSVDQKQRKYYHAMVYYLDLVVGNLTSALKSHGMWDNLLFVVVSDNGGPVYLGGGANNFPLKGGKLSDWQGGVRVNAFAAGGYLPEKMRGQKTEGYIHIADWYATFCTIAGVSPKDEKAAKAKLPPIDSIDMWPLISGKKTESPRKDVPISYNTLISGDYKILTGDVEYSGWTGPMFPNTTHPSLPFYYMSHCNDTGCLYNIKEDPGEHSELSVTMPSVLRSMRAKLKKYQDTYFNPDRGNHSWPGACDYALNKYGGFYGPFLFVNDL